MGTGARPKPLQASRHQAAEQLRRHAVALHGRKLPSSASELQITILPKDRACTNLLVIRESGRPGFALVLEGEASAVGPFLGRLLEKKEASPTRRFRCGVVGPMYMGPCRFWQEATRHAHASAAVSHTQHRHGVRALHHGELRLQHGRLKHRPLGSQGFWPADTKKKDRFRHMILLLHSTCWG